MPTTAPEPSDESARLDYLRACEILDTRPEPSFDSITELAVEIFDVPMATITLIDEDRGWFKARVGVDADQVPRDDTICAFTIANRDVFVVSDTHADERFRNNAMVTEAPYLRFYGGAPLMTQEGVVLGTVAVLDTKPRSLDDRQKNLLRLLAREATALLEQRRQLREQQRWIVQHADEALRETEARYEAMVQASTDLICQFHSDGILSFVNRTMSRFTGRTEAGLLGHHLREVVVSEDQPLIDELLSGLRVDMAPRSATLRIQDDRGRERWCQWTTVPVFDDQGTLRTFQSVGTDISERRALEQQLRQTQKLESIGRLAAGVAHDFNNLLTVIQGNASLLQERLSDVNNVELLDQVADAAERAATVTRQLLLFSRKERMQRTRVNLNEQLAELTRMLGRLLGEDIKLELDIDGQLPAVTADAGMIQQVITNLAVNARDAMPRGGVLRLESRRTEIGHDHARAVADAVPGYYVCLSATDTGSGIDPEVLPRIFEPFFTTKESGRGTGLGLSTVYGIVAQHEGWVEVDTEQGRGSTFRIYLPVQPPPETPTAELPAEGAAGGAETVLVVEDEPGLLQLMVRILSNAGYRVLTAGRATEALQLWERHRDEIAVLLTDQILPGTMRGHELAQRCRQDRPELAMVLMSGYAGDDVHQIRATSGRSKFLPKPFRPTEVLATVRAALDADAG